MGQQFKTWPVNSSSKIVLNWHRSQQQKRHLNSQKCLITLHIEGWVIIYFSIIYCSNTAVIWGGQLLHWLHLQPRLLKLFCSLICFRTLHRFLVVFQVVFEFVHIYIIFCITLMWSNNIISVKTWQLHNTYICSFYLCIFILGVCITLKSVHLIQFAIPLRAAVLIQLLIPLCQQCHAFYILKMSRRMTKSTK